MSFFKGLFNKGAKDNSPSSSPAAEEFDAEWFRAVNRFGIVAGFGSFDFKLRHPQTREIMKPHQGVAGTFEDWKQVQSSWDRTRLLFELILSSVQRSMKAWQIANILTAIRQPDRALALLEQQEKPSVESEDYADHCAAYAKALINLNRLDTALEWARKAVQVKPDYPHFQVVLADALRLSNECDESDRIYSALMSKATKSEESSDAITDMFNMMFARETGAVPSPVFAIEIGGRLKDQKQAESFWQLGELEFYDSPYFRMHHAYYLANQGQMQRCFAKLIALVQEMPWLREPSLNLDVLFKHFDPNGTKVMPEFQVQLRETIRKNGWTTEGMNIIQIQMG